MSIDEQYYTTEVTDGYVRSSANVGNHPGFNGVRSHICTVCGFSYPEDKCRKFRGDWYGVPCGCDRDIPSLIREGRDMKKRSRGREQVYKDNLG